MSAIQAKKDEQGKIYNQMEDLKNRAKKEGRDLTKDEWEQWDKAFAEHQDVVRQIEDLEKEEKRNLQQELLEYQNRSVFDQRTPGERKSDDDVKVEYKTAFEKVMRNPKELNDKEWRALETRGTNTQITGTDGIGGYIVPDEWAQELIKTMEAFGGMLGVSRVISTSHGRQIYIPTVPFAGGGSAATVKGSLIAENAADTVNDINFQQKQLNAYVYTSGEIQWTWEMMSDAMFDVVGLTLEIGGERNGRIVNQHLTTGTGSGQPNGAATAASAGLTAAAVAAITGDEIVDLKYSLDPAYRSNARFMLHDQTLKEVVKLSYGSTDTSVWIPSFQQGAPDTILGHPYTVNNDMAQLATGNRTVLFGDFSKYWVRQAGYPELARSDERDMGNRRSVFYVFSRYDGELVDANAIKYLVQA